jgi:sugar lactone lactonase YvrE
VVEDRLYVADIDRVVGFDIETREPVFEATWEPGAPTLLNDLAVLDDHTLLVSDTLAGTLLALDLETSEFAAFASDVPGANGIAIDARRHHAWIVGVGADFAGGGLFAIDLDQPELGAHRVDGPFGILDGIAVLPNGNLVISDWVSLERAPGRLTVVTPDGEQVRSIELDDLHGPADFYFDRRRQALWIPAMTDNCVRVRPQIQSSSR